MESILSSVQTHKALSFVVSVVTLFLLLWSMRTKDKKLYIDDIEDFNIERLIYLVVTSVDTRFMYKIIHYMKIHVEDFFSTVKDRYRGDKITRLHLFGALMVENYEKSGAHNLPSLTIGENVFFAQVMDQIFGFKIKNLKEAFFKRNKLQEIFDLRFFSIENRIEFKGMFSDEQHYLILKTLDKKFSQIIVEIVQKLQSEQLADEFEALEEEEQKIICSIFKKEHLEEPMRVVENVLLEYQFA